MLQKVSNKVLLDVDYSQPPYFLDANSEREVVGVKKTDLQMRSLITIDNKLNFNKQQIVKRPTVPKQCEFGRKRFSQNVYSKK